MPRLRIIALEQLDTYLYRYALWADVPLARQPYYAKLAPAASAWQGATTADNTAITTGAVVEKIDTLQISPTAQLPDIEAYLQTRWQAYQDEITNVNPWAVYGMNWDGTTWTIAGVA